MKLHLYIILLLTSQLFSLHIFGQSWLSAKQPVFTGHPTNQSDGEAYSVATDNAANVYETGFFAYATMQYGSSFLNSVNPTAFLVKYNATGNALWATQGVLKTLYDESAANAVAVDGAGNVYITGFFMDSVSFGNITLITNPGQQEGDFVEVFLVKYNTNGVVQWAQQSNTTQFNPYRNQGLGVACDHAGNIYITGSFGNTMSFGTASVTTPSGGAGDVFLVKYDTGGNVIWATKGGISSSASFAIGNAVTVDAFNNVLITGNFKDTVTFGNQMLINNAIGGDIFVAKYDSNGSPIWATQAVTNSIHAAEPAANSGNGIATDREGNIYLTGNFADTIYFGSNELVSQVPYQNAIPYGNMLLAKYDPNGNVMWAKATQPLNTVTLGGWSVATDTFDHIYFLGGGGTSFNTGDQIIYQTKIDNDTFVSLSPTSWEYSLVLELDTSGNVLCGSAIPMGGDDVGGITCDPSGKYVFIGQDYNAQSTVYLGGDTINYPAKTGEEIPFIARWSPCTKVSLLLSINHSNVTCNGLCNGQATAEPVGGILPYKYSWNTPHSDTTKTVTGLCAGTYTVVVTDSIGTSASSVVTISQPPVFKVSVSPDTSLCMGDSVILTTKTSGGTGPYTYAWSPSTGLNDTTNAQAVASPSGSTTYSVTATTSGNCTASASVSVNINAGLPVSVTISASPSDTICPGTPLTFTAAPVNAGNPSYQWTLNNRNIAANSPVYSTDSLNNGDVVTCIVTSGASCATGSPATSNPIIIAITLTSQAGVISSDEDTICAGSPARLTVTGNNAALVWQSSAGSNFNDIPGADSSIYTVSPQQTTSYRVIAGSGACTDTSGVFRLIVNALPSAPDIMAVDSAICPGDSTQVCAGGVFSSYIWNTGDTGSCIEVNNAGEYWVTAAGTSGCSVVSNQADVYVYPVPSSISIVVQGDTLSSFGAIAYQWYLNDSVITGATSSLLIAQSAGLYAVQITDSNGCEAVSSAVTITGVTNLQAGKVSVYPNPSTGSWQLVAGNEWIGGQLTIYSADGRIVLSSVVRNTTSTISFDAMSGVYLLELCSPSAYFTYKLIRL